jgi:hypothetical protein
MNKMEPDFPMNVVFEEDESITIEWDPDHPVTSVFNTWTEQDFKDCILAKCKEIIDKHGD